TDPKQGSPVREDFTGLAMRLQLGCERYQAEAGPPGDAADPGRHLQQGTGHPTTCSSADPHLSTFKAQRVDQACALPAASIWRCEGLFQSHPAQQSAGREQLLGSPRPPCPSPEQSSGQELGCRCKRCKWCESSTQCAAAMHHPSSSSSSCSLWLSIL
uniref:Uncharacterized protein n=1 Tax=Cairina moschata TaxID=8855 RepID=A0A8C3BSY8_CAIMO